MKVLILAAGYGTRLYSITKDTPKALLTIGPKTLIDYLIEKVRNLKDLDQIIVVTNNKFYVPFQKWAQKHTDIPAKIHVLNDGSTSPENRLGSMGDIHFVLEKENIQEDLLVIGGDNLFEDPLNNFLQFAQEKDSTITMGIYDIGDINQASKFGVLCLDQNKKIITFEEKPAKPRASLIAMCLYYFPKTSLGLIDKYLGSSGKTDTMGDYINWLCQRENVYAFQFQRKWYDIGSVESYRKAQEDFSSKGIE